MFLKYDLQGGFILQKYVGDSSAPVLPEKKKRAPAKKKEVEPVVVDVPTTDVSTTEAPITTEVPEKKKRAPPKKKVVEPVVVDVPTTEVTTTQTNTDVPVVTDVPTTEVPEKKKRAPPKKKTEVAVAEVVTTEDPVTTVPVTAEVPEKKKRAPAKKKTEPVNNCYLCKNEKDLRSTGNSDGYVCESCISNPESSQAFCLTCKRYEETDGD
jgi:hypothetical protein